MSKEFISHEPGSSEAWVCGCGNSPVADGFYPCNAKGDEMEPTQGSDWSGLYVCARCGRIIRQDTLEVIGRNPNPKLLV